MPTRFDLEPIPTSAAAARRWTVEQAEARGYGDEADTIALLVSELVSNVVLHAGTAGHVVVDADDRRLRVEVHDASSELPGPARAADPLSLTGRGMLLVSALSARHGVQSLMGGGKVVWFELAARST